jgi:hypothetical protein
MRHDRLIEALGGYVEVSHRLRRDASTVWKWQHTGIPTQHWARLLRMAARAGIPLTIESLERGAPRRRPFVPSLEPAPAPDEACVEGAS